MPRFLLISLAAIILATGAMSAYAPVAYAQEQPAAAATNVAKTAGGVDKPAVETDQQKQDAAYNSVMQRIMELFAWLVGVAALTLDYAVFYTVVTMGDYIHNLSAIGVAWRILRDLGNIALIFGFLAVGISIILGMDLYGWGKSLLPKLLVAAVFLNFSLFFSGAIVDIGNLFATQFYTQINGGSLPTANSLSKTSVKDEGISNKIMNQLGLQTLYNVNDGKVNKQIFDGTNPWLVGFLGILLFITTAFVLFSLAFILIARFVALVFLLIAAPIGVAGYAIPPLSSLGKKWWDSLISQTITAPVLLLMLYVALRVITDEQFLVGFNPTKGGWLGFVDNNNLAGYAGVLLSFLVAMGLLLAVTAYAKSVSAFGATWATKMGGRVTGALSFGAVALAGRGVLGSAGYVMNSKRMQARAAQGGVGGLVAKGFAFTGRNLEGRTFDFRNVPGVRKAGSALGTIPGFGGTGAEGIFAAQTKVTAKSAIDTTREKAKYYTGEWWREQQKEYEKTDAELTRKKNISDPTSPDFAKTLKKMSADELAELRNIRKGMEEFVRVLSPARYTELQKSSKLLQTEKNEIKKNWEGQFVGTKAAPMLRSFSTEEIASLDSSLLTKADVIDNLGPTELDAVRRKGALKQPERHAIYAHMTAAPGSTLDTSFRDYLAKDPSGGRDKYWNV